MMFRTSEESKDRAYRLQAPLLVDPAGAIASGFEAIEVRFSLDQSPLAEIAVARRMLGWLGDFSSCELWVTDFGIWPTREDLNLYYKLRACSGDTRRLADAPGHYFSNSDRIDLTTYLSLAIQFGWGAHIVPDPSDAYVFLSHVGWVAAVSKTRTDRILSDLRELEISYDSYE